MVVDIEQLREDEFVKFRAAVRIFFKGREDAYLDEFREKMESGEIDPDSSDYREICKAEAEAYMSSRSLKLLQFIRGYVDERSNELLDAVSSKKYSRGKAKVRLEVLKYVLEAGENNTLK